MKNNLFLYVHQFLFQPERFVFYAFHLLVCPGAFALDVELVKHSSRWIGHIGRILNHDPVASVIPFFIGGGTSREEMVHPAELELRNLAHSAVAMSSVVIGGSVEWKSFVPSKSVYLAE